MSKKNSWRKILSISLSSFNFLSLNYNAGAMDNLNSKKSNIKTNASVKQDNYNKEQEEQECVKVIDKEPLEITDPITPKKDYTYKNDASIGINLNYPINLLVIADTKERMQKVAAVLHNNKMGLSLGELSNDVKNYESGGVYEAKNNPNVHIFCITLDEFNDENNPKNYDWDFICQDTSKIFYIFESKSADDNECFDKLKKFYHKFNKHWCGKDLNYNENYIPYGPIIGDIRVDIKPREKGRNDWFVYVQKKRDLTTNHRYIYFLLDNEKRSYSYGFERYVAQMPDARSIITCKLDNNLNIALFKEKLDSNCETPQLVTLFNYKNVIKNQDTTADKKNSKLYNILIWGLPSTLLATTAIILGINAYKNY